MNNYAQRLPKTILQIPSAVYREIIGVVDFRRSHTLLVELGGQE